MGELERRCVDAGVRMTGQRRTVLLVLDESEDHPSIETVFERARRRDPSISMATVYRTLSLLNDLNLVQRHEFKDSATRVETNLAHHHHLIDVETGEVIEFQDETLEKVKQRIAAELGYELVDHRLELYGRRKKRKA